MDWLSPFGWTGDTQQKAPLSLRERIRVRGLSPSPFSSPIKGEERRKSSPVEGRESIKYFP
jgi:hypothetical protein